MTSRRASSARFVGRGDERASLLEAFEAAAAGEPTTVVIGGEAGVGKTRLMKEFIADLPEPAHVVWGRCMALMEGGPPYGAFRDGLRTYVGALDPVEREELRAHTSAALGHLVSDLGDRKPLPELGDRSSEQLRMFELLLQVVTFLTNERPLVLVIDDLHWADRSTLTLLAFLIQNLTSERALICTTYRSDEIDRTHPLRSWLAEHLRQHQGQLELSGLSRSETRDQLDAILGGAAPEGLVDEIFDRSGGNPFFAEELLVASAAEPRDELPTSVSELLLTRLARLSEQSQALVRAASAGRTPIDPKTLARVLDSDEDALVQPLREAVDHHVLEADRDGSKFVFRHALLREAAYSDLIPGERQQLHRRFAEAIEIAHADAQVESTETLSELAFHWHEAGDARRALAASLAAASAAVAARGFDSALDHYDRVLELWERLPDAAELTGLDQTEVLARAARVANVAGDEERAISLVRIALEEIDPDANPMGASLLHESLGTYLFGNGDYAAALGEFEAALAMSSHAPESVERTRTLAISGRLFLHLGEHDRARALSEQALEQARRLGARQEEGMALNSLGVILATEGRVDEGLAQLRQALAIAEGGGVDEELGRAYTNLGFVLEISGRLREAVEVSMRGAVMAHDWGLDHSWGVLLRSNAAEALFELGEWSEMHALVTMAERSARSHFDEVFVHLNAARLDAVRGDLDGAREHLDKYRKRYVYESHLDVLRGLKEVDTEIALWERRPDDARRAALEGLDTVAGADEQILAGRFLMLALRAHADLAENARDRHSRDDERAAIEGARRVLDIAEGFDRSPLDPARSPLPESSALNAQAGAEMARCEGRHEPDLWDAAAERWETLERPYHAAYARWRCAEAALFMKETGPRPAENLRAAHEIASRLEARPLMKELELLGRRARIPLDAGPAAAREPAPEPAAWEQLGLTERELEVIRYLADGLSNRDIAQRLFISPKTASAHVSNILRKLGVQGRVEAAAVAFRMGLVPSEEVETEPSPRH